MQISNTQIQRVFELHLHKVYSPQTKPAISPVTRPDELVLSGKAAEIQRLQKTLAHLPDLRTGVVKDYQRRVNAGNYEVTGLELADKIATSALEFRENRA